MEPATKAFLRNAILEAVNAEQDSAALELLQLLNEVESSSVTKPAALSLPAAREVIDGAAHDYRYWASFIREHFSPFMTSNGRMRFTSHELFAWLENCQGLRLTSGDVEIDRKGRETWRRLASNALYALKQRGVLNAPALSKGYEIMRSELAPNLLS